MTKPRSLDDVWKEMEEEDYSSLFPPGYRMPERPGLKNPTERRAVWLPAMVRMVEDAFWNIGAARSLVRSPLEEKFLAALWVDRSMPNKTVVSAETGSSVAWTPGNPSDDSSLTVAPQAKVGPYLADFQLTLAWRGAKVRLVVEIDGHDFHEKTKSQAAHDKKRDRFFTANDVAFLRFTGSEVHRDNVACANESLLLLGAMMRKASP